MAGPDLAVGADHDHGRLPTQAQQPPPLLEELGDLVLRVRDAAEGIPLAGPRVAEFVGAVRTRDQDLGALRRELRVILAKTREVAAAEGSGEAAHENENDGLAPVIRQPDGLAFGVDRLEVHYFAFSNRSSRNRAVPDAGAPSNPPIVRGRRIASCDAPDLRPLP